VAKASQQRSSKLEQKGLTRLYSSALSKLKIEKLGPISKEKAEEKEKIIAKERVEYNEDMKKRGLDNVYPEE